MQKNLILSFIFYLTACSSNWKEKSGYIPIADHQIYYQSKGEGAPIIFLHGGYLHLGMWEEQMNYFAENGYQAIAYDDIGHGKTKDGEQEILGANVLKVVMDSLKLEKAQLVGLSWGSMIAVDFCLEYPDRVEKMVLASPGLNGWEYFQDSLAGTNYQLRQKAKAAADTSAFVEMFMRNWSDGPAQPTIRLKPAIRNKIQGFMMETVTNHWGKNWSLLSSNPPARQRLNEIQQPVLLTKGALDAEDIHEIVEIYSENLPNVFRLEIPNVAHTLNLEEVELFNEKVLKFIR